MKFLLFVASAVAIALFGLFLPRDLVQILGLGTSFLAWFAGLLVIATGSIIALRDRETISSRFDMLGASEIVVVYGIFGLLASLAMGIIQSAPLITAGLSGDAIDFRMLLPLLYRFTEGLLAAGVAPLVAVVLRQVDLLVGRPRIVDVVLDPKELEREFKDLELALKGLNREVESMMTRFGGSANKLADAVTSLHTAIADSATAVDASGRELGDAMSRGAATVITPLEASARSVGELERALAALKSALNEAVPYTQALSAHGRDAAQVLDELIEVIGSVRNFIGDKSSS